MTAAVQLRDLLATSTRRLADAGIASARVDAELLAAYVLQTSRTRLSLVDELSPQQAQRLRLLIARRVAREPLQHITGRAPFRHLELAVGPGVFVPRPETELVAQAAIDELRSLGRPGLAVDLCTGSGAIAVAVASEVPNARVIAVELDPVAHSYAVRNVAALGLADRVDVVLGDAAAALPDLAASVDVVVANPPYVPLTQAPDLDPEVRDHDPQLAVFGGPDGLDGPRTVVAAARRLLRPGGLLVVEHDDTHGESATALVDDRVEWASPSDHADLAGRPRFLTARRAPGEHS